MDSNDRRKQLGDFLRQQRESIQPVEVGLEANGRRRTPGLRREEVAQLAGISSIYYAKIEQGKVAVGEQAMQSIAQALHFNHTQIEYVFALSTGRTVGEGVAEQEEVSQGQQFLLDKQDPYPAQILGRRWDFLAWNQATCATMIDLDQLPPQARNLVVMMFTVPQLRQTIGDWEYHAQRILAEFRADYGRFHNDPGFPGLVAYLRDNSPEFDQWWTELPAVGAVAELEKYVQHPTAGTLHMLETVFTVNDHPGMRLILFLPQDEETDAKLHQLYEAHREQKETAART